MQLMTSHDLFEKWLVANKALPEPTMGQFLDFKIEMSSGNLGCVYETIPLCMLQETEKSSTSFDLVLKCHYLQVDYQIYQLYSSILNFMWKFVV